MPDCLHMVPLLSRESFVRLAACAGLGMAVLPSTSARRYAWADEAGGQTDLSPIAVTAPGEHVSTSRYELDLPAFWDGRVTMQGPDESGNMAVISNDYPSFTLMSVNVCDSITEISQGDISGGVFRWWQCADGSYVTLSATNCVYLEQSACLIDDTNFFTEDDARTILDLTTGGAYSLEEAAVSNQGSGSTDGFAFYDATVGASLVPSGQTARERSVLGAEVPAEQSQLAWQFDVGGFYVDMPEEVGNSDNPDMLRFAFDSDESHASFNLQTLGASVEPRHFPLLAYRIAQKFDGQLAYHKQMEANGLSIDVYTVDLSRMTLPPSASKGKVVLGFIASPREDTPCTLLSASVGQDYAESEAGKVEAVFQSIAPSETSASPWVPEDGQLDAYYASLLCSCYDRLAGYDERIATAAQSFNEAWACEDLDVRSCDYAELCALQDGIRREAIFLVGLKTPLDSAYIWNANEIAALVDDLLGRCDPIAQAWEKSISYGLDAANQQDDIFFPFTVSNLEDGTNRYKADYDARYPYARPVIDSGEEPSQEEPGVLTADQRIAATALAQAYIVAACGTGGYDEGKYGIPAEDGNWVVPMGTSSAFDYAIAEQLFDVQTGVGVSTYWCNQQEREGQISDYNWRLFGVRATSGDGTFVSEDTVRWALASVWGWCADDLSFLNDWTFQPTDGGWMLHDVAYPSGSSVDTANFVLDGETVTFDMALQMSDGLFDVYLRCFTVVMAIDPQSAFGFHLMGIWENTALYDEFPEKVASYNQALEWGREIGA